MIKIFHLTNSYSGKTETFIRGFLDSLNAREDIHLYCQQLSSFKSGDIDVDYNVRVESINYKNIFYIILNKLLYKDLFLIKAKGINYSEFKSADIITVDFTSNLKWLLIGIENLDKPIYVFVHGYDLSKVFRKSDFVNWFHSIAKMSNIYFVVPCLYFLNKLIVEFGVPNQRILQLPYGLNNYLHDKIYHSESIKDTNDFFNLLFVGRLVPKKQPLALVEMMNVLINTKKLLNIRLKIIGEGSLYNTLRNRIDFYDLNQYIELAGFIKHTFVMNEISNCDIYVQHSITDFEGDQEGLPNAILEALSLNKPVISTSHSGIPDIIKHGINGFLVNEYDFKAMSYYVEEIYSHRFDIGKILKSTQNSIHVKPWSNDERARVFVQWIKESNV